MRLNKYEERKKYFRRLDKRQDEVWEETRKVEYVELEEPQFAGWDIFVDIDPNCKLGFTDRENLEQVVNILRLHKPSFTRRVKTIRAIRLLKHNFNRILNTSFMHHGLKHLTNYNHNVDSWKYITEKQYLTLSESAKTWFRKNSWYSTIPSKKDFYMLIENINHDLVVRIKKSYITRVTILNSKAESEYKRLDNKLRTMPEFKRNYGKWGVSHGSIRCKWNHALKQLARAEQFEDYWHCGEEPVSFLEIEEVIMRGCKVHAKPRVGA